MSQMTDNFGDKIVFLGAAGDDSVQVIFRDLDKDKALGMVLDRKKARQFINKLLQAFEEDA